MKFGDTEKKKQLQKDEKFVLMTFLNFKITFQRTKYNFQKIRKFKKIINKVDKFEN